MFEGYCKPGHLFLFLQRFEPILEFFLRWEREVFSKSKGSPATELPPFPTMADLKTAVRGMKELCLLAKSQGLTIIPHRINQDCVESWFGHHREACGSNRNMTG